MSDNKTKPTDLSPQQYVDAIEQEERRKDCSTLMEIMQEVTGEPPVMWGDSIVGFGSYHYVYKSGREGDWLLTGFSNRKQAISVYIMSGLKKYKELLEKNGTFNTGSSCLYIKSLDDIDTELLKRIIKDSVKEVQQRYQ